MKRHLEEFEVLEMQLRIPRDHLGRLLEYFDGWHEGERGSARALVQGKELRFEARGGSVALTLEGDFYRARRVEIYDDRTAEFFTEVLINLFLAYRGSLRGRIRWASWLARTPDTPTEVYIENGRTNLPPPPGNIGGWLLTDSRERPEPVPDSQLEEIWAKLDEAERYFAEYLRLKTNPR